MCIEHFYSLSLFFLRSSPRKRCVAHLEVKNHCVYCKTMPQFICFPTIDWQTNSSLCYNSYHHKNNFYYNNICWYMSSTFHYLINFMCDIVLHSLWFVKERMELTGGGEKFALNSSSFRNRLSATPLHHTIWRLFIYSHYSLSVSRYATNCHLTNSLEEFCLKDDKMLKT